MVNTISPKPATFYTALPGTGKTPLPSVEMAQLRGDYLPDDSDGWAWHSWEIRGLSVLSPLLFLKELHYISTYGNPDWQLGSDLRFWIQFSRLLGHVVSRHHFLPIMKCFHSDRKTNQLQMVSGWSPVAAQYEQGLRDFARSMPGVCRVLYDVNKPKKRDALQPESLSPIELLRHFSEQQLDHLITEAKITKSTLQGFKGHWPHDALNCPGQVSLPASQTDANGAISTDDWRKWQLWQQTILGHSSQSSQGDEQGPTGFVLGIRLQHDKHQAHSWWLGFFISATADPSLQINLEDWWKLAEDQKAKWLKHFGQQFERNLLVHLGQAARMCPRLWQAMESPRPTGLGIDLETAYEFLKDDALVLESAGFRISCPAVDTQGAQAGPHSHQCFQQDRSKGHHKDPIGVFSIRFGHPIQL